MKYLNKITVSVVLFFIIFNINVYADSQDIKNIPPNVILQGNTEGIIYMSGDEPFLSGLNMLPGDSISRTMEICNINDSSYKLYLRASLPQNSLLNETEVSDFLSHFNLLIEYNGNIIYQGFASGKNGLEKDILLGEFEPNKKAELKAIVTLDGPNTTNEYKEKYSGKLVSVDWIFTAISMEDKVVKPGQSVEVNNYTKVTTKTGDEKNIVLYAFLFFVSALVLGSFYNVFIIKGVEESEKFKKI